MPSAQTVRTSLREATRPRHDEVDALFGRIDLSDPADYREFLSAHAGALLPIEEWLGSHAALVVDDWPERSRTAALKADMAALAMAEPEQEAFSLSPDPASVAGVLYVVEGSKMGGRVLARSVGEGLPRQYLAAGGNGEAWKKLISRLDDIVVTGAQLDAATRAASIAFDRFAIAGQKALRSVGIG